MRYPDAGSSPNSKTGAAIRTQVPVVVTNVDAFPQNRPLPASYDGHPRARSSRPRTRCCSPSSTTT
ncbi:hypothetical protein MHPYR_60165 [uncultured Mycobacterium sp.]|uniref:Uncharacterized protein n=1 Tax=uncultured Mycobacterium sp. TaxID=171292 RepID=A0A1Y5PIV8_9MYCO|nr:hypothetical protein MHPYR_60165 [uncultured Mycobacterium sp.]